MLSTHNELDFSTMSFHNPIPAQADPTVYISGLKDPQWAFLCMDYPAFFAGTTSDTLYLSPLQYLLYSLCTITGNPNASRILEYTKDYTSSLEGGKIVFDPELAERISLSMKSWINLSDPAFQSYYESKFISIISRASFYMFAQHNIFRQALMATGDRPLVFVNADPYWGNGSTNPLQMTGSNVWGRTLMEVRMVMANDYFQNMPWISEMIKASLPAPEVASEPVVEKVEAQMETETVTTTVEKPLSHPLPENLEEEVQAAQESAEELATVPIETQVSEAVAEVVIAEAQKLEPEPAVEETKVEEAVPEPVAPVEETPVAEVTAEVQAEVKTEETPVPVKEDFQF